MSYIKYYCHICFSSGIFESTVVVVFFSHVLIIAHVGLFTMFDIIRLFLKIETAKF